MNIRKKICAILFLICGLSNLFANDLYFLRINGESGLSHNNVRAIVEDSYGFVWLGTRNGLNRYDGVSLKQFECYDSKLRKRNNNIGCLYEDADKKLWIGTDKGVFNFDPITETFHFFDLKSIEGIGVEDWIADIQADLDGNIWIISPAEGVFKYVPEINKLDRYTVVKEPVSIEGSSHCIVIEKNGKIWIGTNGSGIYLYDKERDSFIQDLGDSDGKESLKGKNIFTMANDNDFLIVGIHEGKLVRFDKRRNTLKDVNIKEIDYNIIRDILFVNDNEIWVATESGITIINPNDNTVRVVQEDILDPYSLSDNAVEVLYKDREGGVWIGTRYGGANYLPGKTNKFTKYFPNSRNQVIPSKRIREIKEDKNKNLWIGTEDAGLMIFNPKKNEFREVENLFYSKTLAIMAGEHEVWVGYFKNGLDRIQLSNNSVIHHSADQLGLDEGSIYALMEDRHGNIWIGNAWGIFVAKKGDEKFKRMDEFGIVYAYDIMEDSDGYIWIATMGTGVFQYNQQSGKITHFINDGKNSLSSNSVNSMTEDHQGKIWFSTDRGGVCVYDKKTRNFQSYSVEDGLPDNVTYKIIEDKNNHLWFGTNKGLVRFNPQTKAIRTFTKRDGLLSDQFNYKSAVVSSSGIFYFGCIEGLISFNPEDFKDDEYAPPLYVTSMYISNEEVIPGAENSPLQYSIIHTDKIKLSHNQSSIGFHFVAIDFTLSNTGGYAYKMENVDDDWIYTKKNHTASYAKLSPGKYIFRVKVCNRDGVWSNSIRSIEIEILPPWWLSTIAILCYILTAILFCYFGVNYWLTKYKKRNEEKQKLFEIKKVKELYEMKIKFFTDIAHEIRTPVTLINGPLELVLKADIQDNQVKRNLEFIETNTKYLLNLINQLLDFRKVESDKFILHLRKIDILKFFDEIFARYDEQWNIKNKNLNIVRNISQSLIIADQEVLTKIVDNLFSNTIKYSENIINIEITLDETSLELKVINDGKLIPEDCEDKIFEPFFQIYSENKETLGSGIGLSLARSLAGLHKGTLHYSSEDGFNCFTLRIPTNLDMNMKIDQPGEEREHQITDDGISSKEKLQLLIVEDNQEMMEFIKGILSEKYTIVEASNGMEAKAIVENNTIDMIVSDIMMPQMNGLELCKLIKSSPEYSHIIFIILTARNDLDSKIKGLEYGAEAYIEKPFSPSYLFTLVNSLHKNRERELIAFKSNPLRSMTNQGLNKGDNEFMDKVVNAINDNISDPNFNVEQLADILLTSRSSLNRRIKATTNMSPLCFIRSVRMQKAASLIQEGKFRVNEISYLVGITTPSYFIKLFQEQYGMTPKEYEIQCRS